MKRNNRERGVALLLALGFSALLLVLVMAFATNALLENKVANANSSREKGQITGEVALARALAALRYYDQAMQSYKDYGLFRFDNVVSRSNNAEFTTWDNQYFVGLKESIGSVRVNGGSTDVPVLKTGGDIVYIYPKTPDINVDSTFYPNADRNAGLQQFQWQYVYDSPPAGEGSTPRIIGRFAYAVLPDMGTLHKSLFNGYAQSGSRIGASMQDLPLSVFTNDLTKGDGSSFSDPLSQIKTKLSDSNTRFEQQVLSGLFTSTSDKRSQSDTPLKIYSTLDLDSSLSRHVTKWFDVGNSTYKDRLDINSAPPSTVSSMKSALPYLEKLPDQAAANLIDYMDTDNVPTSDIAASSWTSGTPTYTGNERTAYISELAINFETKVRARLDNEPVNPDDETQGYFSWWDDIHCAAKLHFAGEIVNLFPEVAHNVSAKGTYKIRLYLNGNINVCCWIYLKNAYSSSAISGKMDSYGFGHFAVATLNLPTYIDIDPIAVNDTGYFYKTVSTDEVAFSRDISTGPTSLKAYKRKSSSTTNSGNKLITLLGTKDVVISRVILMKKQDDGSYANVDFVKGMTIPDTTNDTAVSSWDWSKTIRPNVSASSYITTTVSESDTRRCVTFRYAAKDPRQNLNLADYNSTTSIRTGSSVDYAENFNPATLGSANTDAITYEKDFSGKSGDPLLDFSNSANYVPCYVKNAPMECAEELCFIPRGELNASLNLRKRAAENLAAVNYDDGDAAILDQIKIGSENTREKLSMNTRNKIIWEMIFSGIKCGKGYLCKSDDTGTGKLGNTYVEGDSTVTLGTADAKKIAEKMQQILRQKAIFFQYPSQLVSPIKDISGNDSTTATTLLQYVLNQSAPSVTLTEEQQGILLAKIAPLLKTPRLPESFYLLVLAQSIQDVGGSGNAIPISKVKSNGTTVTKNCTLGTFDFDYNGGTPIYFDRITSQNRMLVKICRTEDANGKSTFKVTRIHYLSE